MLQRYTRKNRIGWYEKKNTYYEALKKEGDKNSQWRPIWWVSSHLMWLSLLRQKDYISLWRMVKFSKYQRAWTKRRPLKRKKNLYKGGEGHGRQCRNYSQVLSISKCNLYNVGRTRTVNKIKYEEEIKSEPWYDLIPFQVKWRGSCPPSQG